MSVEEKIAQAVKAEKKKPTKKRLTVDVDLNDDAKLEENAKKLGISKTKYLAVLGHTALDA